MDEDGFIVDVKSENAPRFYPGHYSGRKALLLEPSRRNLISNSTFEGDVSGWSETAQVSVNASTDRSKHGYYSLKVSASGASACVGTAEGTSGLSVSRTSYTYSGWVFVPSENSLDARLEIAWWNSSGTLIRTDASRSAAKGAWQYLSVTATAPETAATASVRLRGTGSYASGDVFYLDAAQFEAGGFPTSYIPTTNGSATRNAESLTYPTRGNLQPGQGSISLWVKVKYTADTSLFRTFFDASTDGINGIYIYRNQSDKLGLRIGNATTIKRTISSQKLNWTPDAWHHIVATWNRERQQLYLDGTLLASSSRPSLPTQFNDDFSIGDSRNANTPAAATFADAAIYNRVLSTTEVSALFNRTAPPHALAGTTFFADFDEHTDGYSREILSPEPTVAAGTEETIGNPWWFRAASQSIYDPAGNVVRHLDANGNTIRHTYDILNRLTLVQYPKGVDDTFTYDALSRRISVTDAIGTLTYQYDAANQLTRVTYPGSKALTYEYDMAGRRVQMTDPDGGITRYTYDLGNKITCTTDPQNLTTRYTYDTAGRLTQMTLGNGVKTLYTYNNASALIKVEHRKSDDTLINRFDYVQDAVGNRTRLTEANGDYTDSTYDDIYQLLSEVKKDASDSEVSNRGYTYDSFGNRLTMTLDAETTHYTYDANNRLLTAGTLSFEYDANGNMARRTDNTDPSNPLVTQYHYDYRNHLTQITYPDGTKNWFEYGADGVRQTKRTTTSAVQFIYDGFDVIQEISNMTGQTSAEYFHGPRGLLKQRRSNQDQWCLLDGLGSTTALTDSAETVTDTYTYEAFGNRVATTGTTVNPYKYVGGSGYYTDDESDLTLLTFRYYDAALGRFITRDPASVGPNLYAYVSNNPLKYVDPTGLRGMTEPEKEFARKIFDDLIDYDKVEIIEGGFIATPACFVGGALAFVVDNKIYFKSNRYTADMLIHELMHVWQYQTKQLTAISGFKMHAKAKLQSRPDDFLYRYDLYDPRPFQKYGIEQQAQILQDAYRVLYGHYKASDKRRLLDPNLARKDKLSARDRLRYMERILDFKRWAKNFKVE